MVTNRKSQEQKNLKSTLGPAWELPSGQRRSQRPRPLGESSASVQSESTSPTKTQAEKPDKGKSKQVPTPSQPLQSESEATQVVTGSTVMSSRNQRRAVNRNSEADAYGEELSLWKECQEKLRAVISSINESSANILDIRDEEKRTMERLEKGSIDSSDFNNLEAILRRGVKGNEVTLSQLQEIIHSLKLLAAVRKSDEEQNEASTSRGTARSKAEATAASSLYDFDAADSPMPSPSSNVSRRIGGGGKVDRDAKTDRSTPAAKAGSVEPQSGPANLLMRSKQVFSKDDEVAFKVKPVNPNEQTDWILAIVQDVRGEGKSRRYKVLDADVDEGGHQKEFKTSASSMILVPKDGTLLPPLENGRIVLALYPNTTTFYKAEVMGMDGEGKVNLKFEGEESSNTMQAVTRRYVVEYRG